MPETPCPSCGLTVTTDAHAVCPRCGEPLARPRRPRLDPEVVRLALHKTGGRFRRAPRLRARSRGDARSLS